MIGNKNFIRWENRHLCSLVAARNIEGRDAASAETRRGAHESRSFPPPASFISTFKQLFPTQRASGAAARSSGGSLLLPRSAEEMKREEEPRKADCGGCHGDFIPKAAEHGSFRERHSQMSQKEGNGETKARVAVRTLAGVCRPVAVAHVTPTRATTPHNCPAGLQQLPRASGGGSTQVRRRRTVASKSSKEKKREQHLIPATSCQH